MTSVAAPILDAPGAYCFPPDEGDHCYLIYRKIEELAEWFAVRLRFRF